MPGLCPGPCPYRVCALGLSTITLRSPESHQRPFDVFPSGIGRRLFLSALEPREGPRKSAVFPSISIIVYWFTLVPR